MKVKEVPVVQYKTINACMAAYFCCDVKDLDTLEGKWKFMSADGTEDICANKDAIKDIRKLSAWGWVEGKETIHLFVRKSAKLKDVISLLAHEVGHTRRPFHKSVIEEKKACIFAEVARCAFDLSTEILNNGGTTTNWSDIKCNKCGHKFKSVLKCTKCPKCKSNESLSIRR